MSSSDPSTEPSGTPAADPTPSSLPTPVAALLGLVPAVGERIRHLPAKAVTVPVVLLGTALTKAENARHEYDALAERGTALLARLRGNASEVMNEFADDVSARADDLEDRVERLATPQRQPKAKPKPPAKRVPRKKVDTAASPANALAAELVAEASALPEPNHHELPLPDYDGMTLGSLRSRFRTLSSDQLVQLRAYEKAHAARLPVLTMLDNRIAKLAADGTA